MKDQHHDVLGNLSDGSAELAGQGGAPIPDAIRVSLPYAPSANRYWRHCKGRTFVSAEAQAYRKQVAAICREKGIEPMEGPLHLELNIFRPRRVGDLSNRIKVLEDALQGIAYEDDSQIVAIAAYRHDDKTDPRIEVTLRRAA